jgi:hypothetical protein
MSYTNRFPSKIADYPFYIVLLGCSGNSDRLIFTFIYLFILEVFIIQDFPDFNMKKNLAGILEKTEPLFSGG